MAADEQLLPGSKKLGRKTQLGQRLFLDTNLSTPSGQSCSSCHDPGSMFVDPDKGPPTSAGVLTERHGNRNSPTALYALFGPKFYFDPKKGLYVGGQFLDGRVATLKEQAKGPFLNPLEMANPDKASVVEKVRQADYAPPFQKVYGKRALNNVNAAYDPIADAIAAFERTPIFRPFASKYDYFLAGKVQLTDQETRGRRVFEDAEKGNCAACHPDRPSPDGTPPLFTDFT